MNSGKLSFFKAKISTEGLATALTALYGPSNTIRLAWSSYYKAIDGEYDVQLSAVYKSGISETGINYEVDLWESDIYEYEQENQIALGKQFAISKDLITFTEEELPFNHVSAREKDLDPETGWPSDTARIWLLYGHDE